MDSLRCNFVNHAAQKVYSIKEIRSLDAFNSLQKIWNDLAYQESPYAPFLSHEWFKLWLNHFMNSNEIFILLLYKSDRLVAIAPLLRVQQISRTIKVKKLELIGNAYSATRNFIFGTSSVREKQEYLSYIFRYLAVRSRDWDMLDLNGFCENSEDSKVIRHVLNEANHQYCEKISFENWYTDDISCNGDTYINRLPKKLRAELRRRRVRLSEIGELEVKIIQNPSDVDEYMDYYYELYAKSWKKREGIGPNFHRDFARLAARFGWLRLGFLFLDGSPIAAQFRIVYGDLCVFLKTAYDDKYKKYGPGTILLEEMIKHFIDVDKISKIDFGPGGELYKKKWASQNREMKRILVFSKSVKGFLLATIETKIVPTMHKHRVLTEIKNYISALLVKPRT